MLMQFHRSPTSAVVTSWHPLWKHHTVAFAKLEADPSDLMSDSLDHHERPWYRDYFSDRALRQGVVRRTVTEEEPQ